ncbi:MULTISPECIES: hypothetical protein [Arthrospira]|jgi:hypothetical protein|uniref:Uncharacterized protein n=1 Tax=Limnospira platensis NIES-46 TaxID=1236695 RepID=A0A5M3TAY7_LIMPL|nr:MULTISPECIES: hypothetical protein [Arthrospira]AMW28368.1 hypothetical protein AP285_10655 [Arthrospira platensis YZ]KDR56566.1 hypothetical protein APPUASWS_015845 [Arthrospira platensis str. Paraca]MBD2671156.1 hypothetical protein [Arthrospira platensis FACHB-439]MBD2712870.1 hypothetical protein [Arthrospira platensis FACHB-835]MDF2209553.1 hypothetical protein [Arthrospira platensis NCB002]MDT9185520.1 hypothetical protein [Limnospira sp. PMC 289.06]MDT9297675.1 hypothetical protein
MKAQELIPLSLLIITAIAPVSAQTTETTDNSRESLSPVNPVVVNQPKAIAQIDQATLRNACSSKNFDLLPIPFSDVSPDHWAFEAIMNLYYCLCPSVKL